MKLFPAIDLMGGRVVRLEEGRRMSATVFHDNPFEIVPYLTCDGADRLHVVDLDGAFGETRQIQLIAEIIRRSPIPVQVGGGIRDRAAAEQFFSLGAQYVVLGTAAIKTPVIVEETCRYFPGRVIVAVDARDGVVTVEGWTLQSGMTAPELGQHAEQWGAAAILYTDVARDGMRTGPNVPATVALQKAVKKIDVIASGGVGELDHIAQLRDAKIPACIVGRALYDRKFTVAQAAWVAHQVP